jgi:serine O-acetyltransferase
VAFGAEYYSGLSEDAGGPLSAAREALSAALSRAAPEGMAELAAAVRADHEALQRKERRYGHRTGSTGRIWPDLANKVGLQVLAAHRLTNLLHRAGWPLAAKLSCRGMRHLYGADIHWEAQIAPGVTVVHGMGLAISHAARVGPDCTLSQNVTLGMGLDPETRQTGAPVLEAGVHVGPGATLLGPITVGHGSKVMPGAVLTRSVPPRSLVLAPSPEVRPRAE